MAGIRVGRMASLHTIGISGPRGCGPQESRDHLARREPPRYAQGDRVRLGVSRGSGRPHTEADVAPSHVCGPPRERWAWHVQRNRSEVSAAARSQSIRTPRVGRTCARGVQLTWCTVLRLRSKLGYPMSRRKGIEVRRGLSFAANGDVSRETVFRIASAFWRERRSAVNRVRCSGYASSGSPGSDRRAGVQGTLRDRRRSPVDMVATSA